MLQMPADEQHEVLRLHGQLKSLRAENARLREQLESLRAENARLREDAQHLRSALDAHVARANSPALFGPLELSAGTCVGPRRQRSRE